MPLSRPHPRLRQLAIVCSVWTIVSLAGALSTWLRIAAGEFTPRPGWFWASVAGIPLWTLVTPPLLALSRRFPVERRRWPTAALVHALGLTAVLLVDGASSFVLDHWLLGRRQFTYWQHLWRYSFIDAFFYVGVLAVEHAGRYQRLYLERRLRASELEAQLSRAQLQALQMQLRPHFLFNALNTISGLVRIGERDAALTMLAGLGDLLRLLLRSDGAQEVPVRQELELIERYLRIEQVRFGEQLAVEVFMQPGVEEALVPNLILQPLVENAVRHGVGATSGRVTVRVQQRGAALRLEVSDSGDSFTEEPGAGGIGLSNTRDRLERLYGQAQRLDLTQTASGTSAVIELPLHLAPAGASRP